jgi:hypothetical protein
MIFKQPIQLPTLYFWKSARQYRQLYLAIKRFKGQRKIPNLRNAKSIGGNNLFDRKIYHSIMSLGKWILIMSFWRKGIYANNFELAAQSSISIQSQSEQANPLAIDFKDLK